MRLVGSILVAVLIVTSWPTAATAQDDEGVDEQDEAYRELIRDAVQQSRDGRLQEALALFLRAHEMRPSARTLRGIGLVRFGLSDYTGTIRALSASLVDERRPLDDDDRTEAEQILARARGFVAQVRLDVLPEDARVSIDGRDLEREPDGSILLNPGRHELRFEAEGFRADSRRVQVEGGATESLEVRLEAEGAAGARAGSPQTEVRLRVRSEPEGLVLHAFPMSGPDELVPNAVSQVCSAPCAASLETGLYRLAIGRGTEEPVPVDDYRIEDALDLTLHYVDREGERTAGWITGGVLVGTGLVVLATVVAVTGVTGQIVLGLIAGGVMTTGLAVGLPLIAWNDGTALEVLPLEAAE